LAFYSLKQALQQRSTPIFEKGFIAVIAKDMISSAHDLIHSEASFLVLKRIKLLLCERITLPLAGAHSTEPIRTARLDRNDRCRTANAFDVSLKIVLQRHRPYYEPKAKSNWTSAGAWRVATRLPKMAFLTSLS
jgi:hypothetical protein